MWELCNLTSKLTLGTNCMCSSKKTLSCVLVPFSDKRVRSSALVVRVAQLITAALQLLLAVHCWNSLEEMMSQTQICIVQAQLLGDQEVSTCFVPSYQCKMHEAITLQSWSSRLCSSILQLSAKIQMLI